MLEKMFKEYIFAVLAMLLFLIILIGAIFQSQFKTQRQRQTEICANLPNPTTSSICRHKAFTKGLRRQSK